MCCTGDPSTCWRTGLHLVGVGVAVRSRPPVQTEGGFGMYGTLLAFSVGFSAPVLGVSSFQTFVWGSNSECSQLLCTKHRIPEVTFKVFTFCLESTAGFLRWGAKRCLEVI